MRQEAACDVAGELSASFPSLVKTSPISSTDAATAPLGRH